MSGVAQNGDLYTEFSERLTEVDRLTDRIGWGFGDYVGDVVSELADKANYRASPPGLVDPEP